MGKVGALEAVKKVSEWFPPAGEKPVPTKLQVRKKYSARTYVVNGDRRSLALLRAIGGDATAQSAPPAI
jgi:hypothetical protein